MRLREVLEEVILKLGMDKEIAVNRLDVKGDVVKKLLLAANNVIRELASCYLPLIMSEKVRIDDSRLDYTSLSKRVIKIIKLSNDDGNVRFKMYPTYMYADNGIYTVEYSYLPDNIGLDDEIECDIRINEDILTSGIISEYALMSGEYEKGTIYDEKYKEAIKNLQVPRREISVKRRAWV